MSSSNQFVFSFIYDISKVWLKVPKSSTHINIRMIPFRVRKPSSNFPWNTFSCDAYKTSLFMSPNVELNCDRPSCKWNIPQKKFQCYHFFWQIVEAPSPLYNQFDLHFQLYRLFVANILNNWLVIHSKLTNNAVDGNPHIDTSS